ncbi:hypothetical protein D9M71_392360 [compost metagenome]
MPELLFELEQVGLFVLQQAAQGDAGPVGDHFGNAARIDVQRKQLVVVLQGGQSLLQGSAGGGRAAAGFQKFASECQLLLVLVLQTIELDLQFILADTDGGQPLYRHGTAELGVLFERLALKQQRLLFRLELHQRLRLAIQAHADARAGGVE